MNGPFDKIITKLERAVMLVSYITLICVVGLEAMRRMVTGEQAAWGPEVAMYAFIWLSWFALSANIRNGNQLAFTSFRERFPGRVRVALETLDCIIWIVVGVIVISTSVDVVLTDLRFERVVFGTNIPLAAASIAVPLGWAFSMVRILQILWQIAAGQRMPEEASAAIEGRRREPYA